MPACSELKIPQSQNEKSMFLTFLVILLKRIAYASAVFLVNYLFQLTYHQRDGVQNGLQACKMVWLKTAGKTLIFQLNNCQLKRSMLKKIN